MTEDRHIPTCRCIWCASDPDKTPPLVPDLADVPAEVLEAAAEAALAVFGSVFGWPKPWRGEVDTALRAAYPVLAAWVTAQALRKAAERLDGIAQEMDDATWDERVPGVRLSADALRDDAESVGRERKPSTNA